ncbi:universal stress protein [Actinomadura barringtoniae]|uniref:Universal stress protein n=1 Tax=Actinomadura barringtoniae TaxID=1427535 RepID=A0A939PE56_9ACTN|nr:universal stress protein [Actinomadura barringtoniae]MBO2450941.1 universal stress protein [Actinomadura barringtoniae]
MADHTKIVVGVDGSPSSNRAVAWAADEAQRRQAGLRIVYSHEVWGDQWPFDLPSSVTGEGASAMDEPARHTLDAAAEQAGRGRPELSVTTGLLTESAASALQGEAGDAFEIVVGHRGLGGFTGLLLGSVSLKIAERAVSPVVIVRGDPAPARGEVAVGVDLVADGPVLEYAFDAAARRGSRLRVVHGWEVPGWVLDTPHPISLKELEERIRWNVIEAHAPYRKRFPGVQVVEDLPRDHPVEAMVAVSREVDLIVIGKHTQGDRFRIGATGHGILHHADCPVAVIPPNTN